MLFPANLHAALQPEAETPRATTDDGRCFYISIFLETYNNLKQEFGYERFEENYWWVGDTPEDRYVKAQEIADNFIPDQQGLHFTTGEADTGQSNNLEINEAKGGVSGALAISRGQNQVFKYAFSTFCSIDTRQASYSSSQVAKFYVDPTFEGGTLKFDSDDLSLDQDFEVKDYKTNAIDNAGNSVELTGVLSGPGGIIYKGAGTTTLTGENTYTGVTKIDQGVLQIGNGGRTGSLGASSDIDIQNEGSLWFNREDNIEIKNSISGSGSIQKLGEGILSLQKPIPGFVGEIAVNLGTLELKDSVLGKELDDYVTGATPKLSIAAGATTTALGGENYVQTLEGAGDLGIEENAVFVIQSSQISSVFKGQVSGKGDLVLSGSDADLTLTSGNTLEGDIIVNQPQRELTPKQIILKQSGTLGSANLKLEGVKTELVLDRNNSFEFANGVSGKGSILHRGEGTTTLSGTNTYEGSTTVEEGVLAIAKAGSIPKGSKTVVNGAGQLDLYTSSSSGSIPKGEAFKIDQVEIQEVGQLFVSARNPLVANTITMNANGLKNIGGIAVEIFEKFESEENKAPIRVSGKFNYQSGALVVQSPVTSDPEGTWNIVAGEVSNAEELAKNTYLVTGGPNRQTYKFSGLNVPILGPAMYKGSLKADSLNLVIEAKTPEEIECQLNPENCAIDLPSPDEEVGNLPPIYLPSPDEGAGNELPDLDGDGELDQLPGCEVGDDLCDIISDIPGDEDDALGQEEDLADDVIDGLLDGLAEEEIDLPLSFDYGQLAKLVVSGLLPRNVDAPGRSLFNYNNLLVDTVFERLPLRQFKAVEVAEVVEEEAVMVEPEAVSPAEPIRGLWSQTEGMDEQQAQEYLAQRVAQGNQVVVEDVDVDFELDGIGYVEDPSLTGQYANREGVRAWYRAFGGDTGPTKTSTLYGNYNASASGMVLGADVSLGSNVQIGVFGNYGDVNLYQYSGDTGSGSWNPTGWGGGITADWWSKNFYVQGLISASSFSGNQKRNIIAINEQLGNETARGDKNVTSYSYALRLGAPFEAGRLLLEPQFTAAWTQNQESGFTEKGADQLNLRYGSRTTNFLQTELGMKFALPIKSGERGEWVPNLRVAWLGDWNQNNEDQSIGYEFTDKKVGVDSLEDDQNGVLIEGGLDYTMANINNGSWKLYVRGGAEVWGGERGTDWRASGGMTWQF